MSTRSIQIGTCDVCGVDDQEEGMTVVREAQLTVVFTTEQTEGRPITPSLKVMSNIDLCRICRKHMTTNREMLMGAGAQGHNRYWFASKGVVL